MKQKMLIIVGPSGAGKSTFVEKVCAEYPVFEDTVTYTTRPMREGESEGQPYHFVTEDRFQELIQRNFFVEWAQVHDRFYGTPWEQIEQAWERSKVVIMDVDVQGAKTFKSKFPTARTVFILPPSINVLRQRVMKRDEGRTADIDLRMKNAAKEIAQAGDFDHQIVNKDFTKAYGELQKIIEDLLESR